MQILVVEDEPRMAALLSQTLREEGHQATVAYDGRQGLEIAQSSSFDVIVLDVMLPSLDGLSVAKKLRAGKDQTPLLMLTGRDAPADIVAGLDSGADDYLTKPFPIDVFLARIRSVSRRGSIPRPVLLEIADLQLDPATHQVTRGGKDLSLTPREYALLELLMRNEGRTVSRETILSKIWGFQADVTPNTVDVFMRLLRLKMDFDPARKLIHTVRGFGYLIK